MDKRLELNDFKLKKITFEYRYDPAYLLWDKAGAIWTLLKEFWPNLVHTEVSPNQTSFKDDDNFFMKVNLDRASITAFNMKKKEILQPFDFFLNTSRKILEIKSYTRLGFRFIYQKKCASREEASESFRSLCSIDFPQGKLFNIEGKIFEPELSFRWEDDSLGLRTVIKAEEQSMKFDAPVEIDELDSIKLEIHNLSVDLDYYTKVPSSPGGIKVSELIDQIYHFINRDNKKLIF